MGLQSAGEVSDAYGAYGTPSALVVGTDGRVASELVYGIEAIRELVASQWAGTLPVSFVRPAAEAVAGGVSVR